LDAWLAERDRLEEELSGDVPELGWRRRMRHVCTRDVAEHLPPGSVLVDVVYYRECNFRNIFRRGSEQLPGHYAAFIVPAGAPERLRLVDLGPTRPIDELVLAWRKQLAAGEAQPEAAVRLRAAVWDRLAPCLGEARRVVLSLDGELIQAPFDALPLE